MIRLVIFVGPLLGYKVGGYWVVENVFSWPENNKVNIYLFYFHIIFVVVKQNKYNMFTLLFSGHENPFSTTQHPPTL